MENNKSYNTNINSGKNSIMLRLAILSVALVTMVEAGISPALPGIAKAFSNVDISLIQLVGNMPGLLVIPASLLCGVIAKYVGKRRLTIIAIVLFLVFSCAPALVNNFAFLLTMRALSGASCGLLLTLAAALIPDFYQGKEQEAMQGYKNAVANFGGIITSSLGGILATISWQASFWVFLIGVIPLVLTTFFLPEPKKVEKIEESSKDENVITSSKGPNMLYMFFLCAGFFLFMVFYFGFYTNESFVIVGEHIGNAANAGFVLTMATIGGIISGLVFGKLNNIFKRFTGSLAVGLMAACFLIFGVTKSMIAYFIGGLFFGMSFTIVLSFIFALVAEKVPKSSVTMWFSVLACIQGVGGFLSSIILVPIARLIGGGSLYRTTFLFAGICLVIGCIITVLCSLKGLKNPSNNTLNNVSV